MTCVLLYMQEDVTSPMGCQCSPGRAGLRGPKRGPGRQELLRGESQSPRTRSQGPPQGPRKAGREREKDRKRKRGTETERESYKEGWVSVVVELEFHILMSIYIMHWLLIIAKSFVR